MKYVVSILMLGYTRISGAVVYDTSTREFDEITPNKLCKMIDNNEVVGIKYSRVAGELKFQNDETWCDDIPIKTAVGKFRWLNNENTELENSSATLVKVINTDYRGTCYEIITNKCSRIKLDKDGLIELNSIQKIAGLRFNESNEIVIDSRVIVENRTSKAEEDDMKKKLDQLFEQPIEIEAAVKQEEDVKQDSDVKQDLEVKPHKTIYPINKNKKH